MSKPELKLSLMYSFLTKFIQHKLENNKGELQEAYKVNQSQLYQMHFVINKLDAPKLAKLDFIINFGVTIEEKNQIIELLENGGGYEDVL